MRRIAYTALGCIVSLCFAFTVFLMIFGLLSDLYIHNGHWLETLLITGAFATFFWIARRWVVARLPAAQRPVWKSVGLVLSVLMSVAAAILFVLNG